MLGLAAFPNLQFSSSSQLDESYKRKFYFFFFLLGKKNRLSKKNCLDNRIKIRERKSCSKSRDFDETRGKKKNICIVFRS